MQRELCKMNVQDVARTLTESYETPRGRLGLKVGEGSVNDHLTRHLIANILVAGGLDSAAVSATVEIFETDSRTEEELEPICKYHKVRFPARKAKLVAEAFKRLEKLDNQVPTNLKALQAFNGVGKHAAQIILGLGANQPHFGIDLHVRRIMRRMGLGVTDSQLAKAVTDNIPSEKWVAFSRSFVEFGQEICSKIPNCSCCPFSKTCPTNMLLRKVVKTQNPILRLTDGKYSVVAGSSNTPYSVTVSNNEVRCNCKGYRFRRTCSHVGFAQAKNEGELV